MADIGTLHCEEQIQVVIRIKPDLLSSHQKCVYVSKQNPDQLVVQTPNKKQFFVFDDIADEKCSQADLYQKIGKKSLEACKKGYNCCMFAYGQTGAGKTYSVLGKMQQIIDNLQAQSRGIIPRLFVDLFQWLENDTERAKVYCSYMEIYNEQVFDLLNPQNKPGVVREDLKRGIFVDGITEEKVQSQRDSMDTLLKGLKYRKVASTSMNDESSRSHTIFTIKMEYEVKQEENMRIRKSKLHIVDLAGSQRVKQANLQGQRFKQGCNINRSLHVLGNVINALAQSSKKKKHIPYRDSKLTHFLKDSLGGNSVTNLLANVEANKKNLSDTLSTLMFAKRAKTIRLKVQVNQKSTQTFESLRQQVRKLRKQLAQARYIQQQSKISSRNCSEVDQKQSIYQGWEKTSQLQTNYQQDLTEIKNSKVFQILEDNELQYKSLIQIYQDHMSTCSSQMKSVKVNHFQRDWKHLQNKNRILNQLVRNFPAFTTIYKQNLYLKADLQSLQKKEKENISVANIVGQVYKQQTRQNKKSYQNQKPQNKISMFEVQQIINEYDQLLENIQKNFQQSLEKLENSYDELLLQNKQKDEKIKQLKRKKQNPPDIQALMNQNQYLKLNIMELEDEIQQFKKNQVIHKIQLKQQQQKQQRFLEENADPDMMNHSYSVIYPQRQRQIERERDKEKFYLIRQLAQRLEEVKKMAETEAIQALEERQLAEKMMVDLKEELIKFKNQNRKLSNQLQHYFGQNRNLKKKMKQSMNTIPNQTSSPIIQSYPTSPKNFQSQLLVKTCSVPRGKSQKAKNQESLTSAFDKQQQIESRQASQKQANFDKIKLQKFGSAKSTKRQKFEEDYMKREIMDLHRQYSSEIEVLKAQIASLKICIQQYKQIQNKSQKQFSKSLDQLFEEYKLMVNSVASPNTKLTKSNLYPPANPKKDQNKGPGIMMLKQPSDRSGSLRWLNRQKNPTIQSENNSLNKKEGKMVRTNSKNDLKVTSKFKF